MVVVLSSQFMYIKLLVRVYKNILLVVIVTIRISASYYFQSSIFFSFWLYHFSFACLGEVMLEWRNAGSNLLSPVYAFFLIR